MPTADFETTTEGAEISGNAGKRKICKTLRHAKLGSSELELCLLCISVKNETIFQAGTNTPTA
jgi:hypothetical protein